MPTSKEAAAPPECAAMTTKQAHRPTPWQQKSLFPGSGDDSPRQGRSRAKSPKHGRVPSWFLSLKPSNSALRFYTFAACEFASPEGKFWHSDPVLAQRVGLSVRTIQRVIKELTALGALTVQTRYGKAGGRISNLYTLHFRCPAPDTFVTTPVPHLSPPGDTPVTTPPKNLASTQLCASDLNQTQLTKPKEPPTDAMAASCSDEDIASVGATAVAKPTAKRSAPPPYKHIRDAQDPAARSRQTGESGKQRKGTNSAPAPRSRELAPLGVSGEFQERMAVKYPDLKDIPERIAAALNHKSVRNAYNVEQYADSWLRRDMERQVTPVFVRGNRRVEIETDYTKFPDKF